MISILMIGKEYYVGDFERFKHDVLVYQEKHKDSNCDIDAWNGSIVVDFADSNQTAKFQYYLTDAENSKRMTNPMLMELKLLLTTK